MPFSGSASAAEAHSAVRQLQWPAEHIFLSPRLTAAGRRIRRSVGAVAWLLEEELSAMRYALTDRERNNIQPTCRASHAAFRAAQRANVKTLDPRGQAKLFLQPS